MMNNNGMLSNNGIACALLLLLLQVGSIFTPVAAQQNPFGGNNIRTGEKCGWSDCSHDRTLKSGEVFCSTVGQNECFWCPCSGHGHCCDGTSKGCTFKTDTPVSKSVCKCDTHYSGDDCSTHCDPLTGKCANINTNVCHLPPLDTRDHCTFPPNHHEAYDNCDRCTSVSGCVWCPGCPGNEPNHPRCVTDKGGKSCGLMDTSIMLFGDNSGKSRTCKSQCTEETCPVNSLCTDGANGKSICTCKPGYFAPPVAKKGHELPSQCVPRPAQGGLVAHVCQDYGNPSDALANCLPNHNSATCMYNPHYDAPKACSSLMNRGSCTGKHYSSSRLRLLYTWCPKSCGLCHNSAHLPCTDFSAIDSACPVHAVGRLIPSTCDDLDTNMDDSCRDVFTEWFGRCFPSQKSSLPTDMQNQLTQFNTLCSTTTGH